MWQRGNTIAGRGIERLRFIIEIEINLVCEDADQRICCLTALRDACGIVDPAPGAPVRARNLLFLLRLLLLLCACRTCGKHQKRQQRSCYFPTASHRIISPISRAFSGRTPDILLLLYRLQGKIRLTVS